MEDYVETTDPSVVFGRNFLIATKCTIDFGLGEMQVKVGELQDDKDVDWLLEQIIEVCDEDCNIESTEMVKMGKASRLKQKFPPFKGLIPEPSSLPHPTQLLKGESSSKPTPSLKVPPPPKETIDEAKCVEEITTKFKELLHEKPILHVLEHYAHYRKLLDEISVEKMKLDKKSMVEEEEEEKVKDKGLPKKKEDPGNCLIPLKVNGNPAINVLADTGASVSVIPYKLYKLLELGRACPSNDVLLMADNTMARAYGKVKNVRLQIGFQTYLCDFLILHVPIDKEMPMLVGRTFFSTCGAINDIGKGTMEIDDGVARRIYHAKKRNKILADEGSDDEDWLDMFDIGHDSEGNPKYGFTAPSFKHIKDDMERALAMENYFNPFKNIIVYKKDG